MQEIEYFKMKGAPIYMKRQAGHYAYFCSFDIDRNKGLGRWLLLDFKPNLDRYHIIAAEPQQIPMPTSIARQLERYPRG